MPEEALVGRDGHPGPFDLVPVAVPRSCQTHSQTWAMAWAGMASPKHDRPPEGFTGTRPPSEVTPSRSSFSASPSPHRPMSSYQSSSSADDRS